jgi:hypothetical protein
MMEQCFGCADFQESACPHDGDARGDLSDDGQAMRNENVGERKLTLEFQQQK